MRDSSRKCSDRFHFLGLPELALELPPLRQIANRRRTQYAFGCLQQAQVDLHGEFAAVLAQPTELQTRSHESSLRFAENAARNCEHFSRSLSGTKISIDCPSISSRRYPNDFSACALTRTIRPSRSTATMGSGADSSRPRNLASASRTASASRFCRASNSLCERCPRKSRTLEQAKETQTAATASFSCCPCGHPQYQ